MFTHSRSSLEKPNPIPDENGQSVYPFSDQNGPKTLPDGEAHTSDMSYIREKPPSGRNPGNFLGVHAPESP